MDLKTKVEAERVQTPRPAGPPHGVLGDVQRLREFPAQVARGFYDLRC
jgi:hypothetical protein